MRNGGAISTFCVYIFVFCSFAEVFRCVLFLFAVIFMAFGRTYIIAYVRGCTYMCHSPSPPHSRKQRRDARRNESPCMSLKREMRNRTLALAMNTPPPEIVGCDVMCVGPPSRGSTAVEQTTRLVDKHSKIGTQYSRFKFFSRHSVRALCVLEAAGPAPGFGHSSTSLSTSLWPASLYSSWYFSL